MARFPTRRFSFKLLRLEYCGHSALLLFLTGPTDGAPTNRSSDMLELVIHLSEISLAVTTPWLALVTRADVKLHKPEHQAPAFPTHLVTDELDGWRH